ncbi:hypothetical protein [Paramaledivibacter caminithermalis]|jgi:hypothetical protein|uniref:Uncharacterized protein n=1 Tax=Paramaledivibacter caminithermalis (strain DSM 15212 / CIP 107654 / DViRD3) TaxID=1121301 RepID=A0A1M6P9D9_PARC5|nr:hypothetical protein [Paramaledivibacter caminithermalis]SHK04548.1 hypothetical protein SAMN02745912_02068 [Paramaledivibacter caminithermalis DSM 15212]
MFILVILGYLIVGTIEMIPLYKENRKKELIIYSIFFTAAFIISLLLSLDVKIPSPTKPIENIVNKVLGK